jgi:transposase InsO family protein
MDQLVFGDGEHYQPGPKSTYLFDTDLDAVAAALDLKCAQSVCPRGGSASLRRTQKPPLPERTGGRLWRWRRDLNPRTGVTRHTLSRRAP